MAKPTEPAAQPGTSRAQRTVATGQTVDERKPAEAALQLQPNTPTPPTEQTMPSLTRQQKWSRANPLKRWAHMALRSAVRQGLVAQRACEDYGSEKSEAHHTDYSRPIHVQWLCRACHMAAHKRLKGAAFDDNASL